MARIPTVITETEGGWSDWIWIAKKLRIVCCECGLTHDHEYKVVKGKLYWRVRENLKSTAAVRRKRGK